MSTMTLILPASLKALVELRVAEKGYRSPSEYLEALVREDLEKAENDEIEGKLLEALQGAPAAPVTAETWDAIKQEGLRRLEAMRSR
jgi:Arc/MetJ-type ribon-helix-helix transcriptional regulator